MLLRLLLTALLIPFNKAGSKLAGHLRYLLALPAFILNGESTQIFVKQNPGSR